MRNGRQMAVALVAVLVLWSGPTAFAQLEPPAQDSVLKLRQREQFGRSPVASHLNLGDEFTLELWYYPEEADMAYANIMGSARDEPNLAFFLQVVPGVEGLMPSFTAWSGSGGAYLEVPGPDFSFGEWHHLAGTLSDGTMRLFVNGTEVNSEASPSGERVTDKPLYIGRWPDYHVGTVGLLCQARVWNRALSSTEIAGNASRYLTGAEEGLVAYWPLDDGQGTTCRDLTSNGADLTIDDPLWFDTSLFSTGPYFVAHEHTDAGFSSDGSGNWPIDFDDDGDLDFLMAAFPGPDDYGVFFPIIALQNDGGVLTEVTEEVLPGSPEISLFMQTTVGDFNGDGRDDMYAGDWPHPCTDPTYPCSATNLLLMQTPSGTLSEEAALRIASLRVDTTHDASTGDIDGDEDLDIYVGNCWSATEISPYFLINDGNGYFTERSDNLPTDLTTLWPPFLRSALVDVDNDGDTDLFLSKYMLWSTETWPEKDYLLLNDGTGVFTYAPPGAVPHWEGDDEYVSYDIKPADFNNDGFVDLMLGLMPTVEERVRLQLLLNNQDGTFRDASERIMENLVDIHPMVWRNRVVDINGDGWLDLVVNLGGQQPSRLYINTGEAVFVHASQVIPGSTERGFYYPSDFDLDGDVDLMQLRPGAGYTFFENVKDFTEFDTDHDNDGLTDWQELMDLDPETPGDQNPFDPQDADTTGDDGDPNPDGIPDGQNDWDGDGMTNAQELAWGYNPFDDSSYGTLPIAGLTALGIFVTLTAVAGATILRKRRAA